MSDEQQPPILSPGQVITIIVLGFLLPIILVVAVVNPFDSPSRTVADAMTPEAIAERLAPVGHLVVAGEPEAIAEAEAAAKAAADEVTESDASAEASAGDTGDADTPVDLAAGEKVYKGTCGVCHDSGVAGAPKHGDPETWGPRLEQGIATLNKHAIEGIRAMPARGGNAKLSNQELRDAVAYMVDAVE